MLGRSWKLMLPLVTVPSSPIFRCSVLVWDLQMMPLAIREVSQPELACRVHEAPNAAVDLGEILGEARVFKVNHLVFPS